MSRKREVSSNFWEINVFDFNNLHNIAIPWRLFQFETKTEQNNLKANFPRVLRPHLTIWWGRTPAGGGSRRRIGQIQRNELGLVGTAENWTREIAPQHDASSTEGDSRGQRYRTHDDAQENNVYQQVGNIIFLVEIRVLIP